MFYNKLYGLKMLQKTFKNHTDISVLPYHVIKNPGEFHEISRQYSGTPRFLIRTNLRGNTWIPQYTLLPRRDATSKNAIPIMTKMLKEWKTAHKNKIDKRREKGDNEFVASPNSIHFIVHPVEERTEYLANIRLRKHGNKFSIIISDIGGEKQEREIWRNPFDKRIDGKNKRDFIQKMVEIGLSEEDAMHNFNNIHDAYNRLMAEIKQKKPNMIQRWNASCTIRKTNPTKLEFYDLIFEYNLLNN